MNMMTRDVRFSLFLPLFLAVLLLPRAVAAQVLSVAPTSVSVQASAGTNAPSQTVQITNAGNGALKWSVQESSSWLNVSPASGINSDTLTLTFQTSGLAGGQYQTSFRINSNGGSTDVSVQVTIGSGGGTTAPPPPPSGADISVSPTTASPGSSVTVSFSIPNATATNWIALARASDPSSSYLNWIYASSCTQTPGTAKASGSCSFTVPSTAGTYQFRLFASDTLLDSATVTVTTSTSSPPPPSSGGTDISASPTNPSPGSSVTVSFSVANPTSTDWISLAPAGSDVHTYNDWKYAGSCTQNPGTTKASGSCSFAAPTTAGSYEFRLFANDVFTMLDSVTVTVATTAAPSAPQPPPPSTGYGPQSSITCPSGAVDIWPGSSIQGIVNNYAGNTTFCLRAGTHSITSAITPKTGNTFVGQYGAILDGSGWGTSDDTQAAFRSQNQDIDYVTIRNLVIRNMPQRGINAYYYLSDHWTIEYTEIASNRTGIVFPADTTIRNSYIHHNSYAGYMAPRAHNSLLENNEIAYNGWEQKVAESANVTFRNNFVHHNVGVGIWFDYDNTNALVEGNRVEDNGHIGIFFEIGSGAIIRNNAIRRSKDAGVFLGTSKNSQIYGNTFEGNFRGITYFLNCPSLGGGSISFDLANNTTHDNTIVVGTQSGALASAFSYASCTSTQVAPYLNGSKSLSFSRNTYRVPSPNGAQYWLWNGLKYWNEWLAVPQDSGGSVGQ